VQGLQGAQQANSVVRGQPCQQSLLTPPDAGLDRVAYAPAAAAESVLAAFAEDGVPERRFALPEIATGFRFPGAQSIGFHFIDYVVHGWDVARSLGLPFELDADLAEPALRIAQAVPDGPRRLEPHAAFRPGLPAAADAAALHRILATLGRSPAWPN
jgi:uncharacterized protein (TIGR03086 family)